MLVLEAARRMRPLGSFRTSGLPILEGIPFDRLVYLVGVCLLSLIFWLVADPTGLFKDKS